MCLRELELLDRWLEGPPESIRGNLIHLVQFEEVGVISRSYTRPQQVSVHQGTSSYDCFDHD